ncbi:MAG: deoxyribonuclease V [Candidatus Brocadiia bacterium]|nr:MAG: deoxyribonuclease V [Candidatus Brocadiia bacterium]
MLIQDLHDWNISYAQAAALQKILDAKVRFTPIKKSPKLIAGLDCAFTRDGRNIIAAVVVLTFPNLEPVEHSIAVQKTTFPYIPGFLSFREAPACLEAVKKLNNTPDVFLIDGQGIAHPRRLGLASHLGLFLNKTTIGCAKSRLTGTFEQPQNEKGSNSPLKDNSETIGAVLRTRKNVKPLFISVGHKCALTDAINITLKCTTKYRLPEPTRLAHHLVTKHKSTIS